MMGAVKTNVEELPENRVRLEVEVPSDHIKHAVEHASSDLAATHEDPGLPEGQGPAEGARGARRARPHLQRGRRVAHRRLVLERGRRREHPTRLAAGAQLRASDLGGRAVQLHGRVRRPAAARGRRLERARGTGARGRTCRKSSSTASWKSCAPLSPSSSRSTTGLRRTATSSSSTSSTPQARPSATTSSSSAPAVSSRRSSAACAG